MVIPKRYLYAVLAITLCAMAAALFFAVLPPAAADGEPPLLIASAEELLSFLENPEDALYELTADIDLAGEELVPAEVFYGTLDGRGFEIRNCRPAPEKAALIIDNRGEVRNLSLRCAWTESSSDAALIINNYGVVRNCAALGEIVSTGEAAGICIKNSGIVFSCFNYAAVNGAAGAAGIAVLNEGEISHCFNFGETASQCTLGGITAINKQTVDCCYNTAEISLRPRDFDFYYVGGIAGRSEGSLNDCYNAAGIKAYDGYNLYSGAVVGMLNNSGSATNCYFDKQMAVEQNPHSNKGGRTQSGAELTACRPLTTLQMSGAENALTFDDITDWILLADDLDGERVYYPQLACFYVNEVELFRQCSVDSVERAYATCKVTLKDDEGEQLAEYSVFAGESPLPEPLQRSGFINAGWSLSQDGPRLAQGTIITQDITLYAVYDFAPLTYSFPRVEALYGNTVTAAVTAAHSCPDAAITYQWYRSTPEGLEKLTGRTQSGISLRDVADSGYYRCEAKATYGRYETTAYDTREIRIRPMAFPINAPVISKIYGTPDDLILHYSVTTGYGDEQTDVEFTREDGENAGYYAITGAHSLNNNFLVTLVEDTDGSFIINKASYTYSFGFLNAVFVYDGEEHFPDYTADLPIGLSVGLSMVGDGVSVGEHLVTADFMGDFDNYYAVEPVTEVMRVLKATYNMSGVSFYGSISVYNGAAHGAVMIGELPSGVSAVYSPSVIKDAGDYTVTVSFTGDFDSHNAIPSRQVSVTVLPKGLLPEFHLPESMVADGTEKVITVSANGVVQGDEAGFRALCALPLVAAGSYVVTAVCDNENYILYNDTIVIQIYAPSVENSGDSAIPMRASHPDGLPYDVSFIARSAYLEREALAELGDSLKTVFYLHLAFDGEEYFFDEELTVALTVPEGYLNASSLEVYFYDEDSGLTKLNSALDGNTLSFTAPVGLGYFVLSVVPAAYEPPEVPPTRESYLTSVLYIALALILILIIILIFLIITEKRGKRAAPPPPPERKPVFEPLSPAESAELRQKLERGEFVDWELNRDLTLYGTFAEKTKEKTD